MVSPRTVLVTGGAGFLGSHLVDRLLDLGHRVVVVDDLSTGRLQNLNKGATFYHASITSPALGEIIEREKPDVISHYAGQASVTQSVRDPSKDAEINIQGSVRLIEASRRNGIGKFIYASDAAVYGELQSTPCNEDHPIQPISPFGLSKYVVEEYLRLYHRLHRLNYSVLRYGSVYGPCQDLHGEAGVIAAFTSSMLDGKQPRIFGTGNHERDFVYIDDAIEANILAMKGEAVGSFNIGSGKSISVNAVFELLKKILKYRWNPSFVPARPGESTTVSLDFSRAERELGWRPTVTLEEGIRHTVERHRHPVRPLA